MSGPGEDVYDVGVAVWCELCRREHPSCTDTAEDAEHDDRMAHDAEG